MKKLTIYNVYVEMQDQAQCDRMKQLCIDNELDYWKEEIGFEYYNIYPNFFSQSLDLGFAVWLTSLSISDVTELTKVTEQEFIELLKNK